MQASNFFLSRLDEKKCYVDLFSAKLPFSSQSSDFNMRKFLLIYYQNYPSQDTIINRLENGKRLWISTELCTSSEILNDELVDILKKKNCTKSLRLRVIYILFTHTDLFTSLTHFQPFFYFTYIT